MTIVITPDVGLSVHPTEVKFARSNWSNARPITVTAAQDSDSDDNDAGASVSPDRIRFAEGDSGTIEVKLDTPPSANVTVTPSITGNDSLTVAPSTWTFTTNDWNTPKEFVLTAPDNSERGQWDSVRGITASFSSASTDSNYQGLTSSNVWLEVADEEGSGGCVVVRPSRLYLDENGTAIFYLGLCTPPTARAGDTPEVDFRIDAGGDVTANPARATFTTSYWASRFVITVMAANDADGANDEVMLEITGNSNEYNEIMLPDDTVTVADSGPGRANLSGSDEAGGLRLSWDPPPTRPTPVLRTDVRQYELERLADVGTHELVHCVDGDTETCFDEDIEAGKLYVYRIRAVYYANTRCAALRDIELSSGTAAAEAAGVWSDGSTIWVAHDIDNKLCAYDLDTGQESTASDITTHNDTTSNPQADYADLNGGLWGDPTRIWTVTDNHDRDSLPDEVAFIPYRKSDGTYLSANFVPAEGDMRQSSYPFEGDMIREISNAYGTSPRDKLLAYPLHNNRQYSDWSAPPAVTSISVPDADITQTEAKAIVDVGYSSGGTLNLRNKQSTVETLITTSSAAKVDATTPEFELSGLTSDRTYDVEASFDRSFPSARSETTTFRTLGPVVENIVFTNQMQS